MKTPRFEIICSWGSSFFSGMYFAEWVWYDFSSFLTLEVAILWFIISRIVVASVRREDELRDQ